MLRGMVTTVFVMVLALAGCGSGDPDPDPGSIQETATAVPPGAAADDGGDGGDRSCGLTLADVQALLPVGTRVSENPTPDPGRCNFSWDDRGPRGIDVAFVAGGRAAVDSADVGADRVPLDGDALDGLGGEAFAFGNDRQVSAVALLGDDVVAVDVVADTDPGGPITPDGLDAGLLDLCTRLLARAVAAVD
jgi:hypothetical protein